MNIKDNCWVDTIDCNSVYYCGVMMEGYGVTYHIQKWKVTKWFWRGFHDFGSNWRKIRFDDLPEKVQQCFSDPFLEIELGRFKILGLETMDIL